MSFGLAPKAAFPRPQSDGFPQGIQWQADGIALGDRHVQTVNLIGFGSGGVTRDQDTLSVVAAAGGGAGAAALTGFSASLTSSQTSGTRLLFDNVVTNGGEAYAGYSSLTGVLTIGVGDGGLWMFNAGVEIEAAAELVGSVTRFLRVNIGGSAYATSNREVMVAFDTAGLNANSGVIRVADGAQVTVDINSALSATGIFVAGGARSRFSAVRLGD